MKKKKKTVKPTGKFKEFVRSDRFARLRGACYILFSLFLLISLISLYFAGGDKDANWLGALGGAVSLFFAKTFFGVGSLGIAFLFFLYGLRLWKVHLLPWWKTFGSTLFWMLWLSVLLGYIGVVWVQPEIDGQPRGDGFDVYMGIVGGILAQAMYDGMRWWTFVMLLFAAGVFLVFVHHVRVKLPEIDLHSKKTVKDIEPLKSDVEDVPVMPEKKRSKRDRHAEAPFVDLPEDPKPAAAAGTESVPLDIDDEFARLTQKYQNAQPEPEAETQVEMGDPAILESDLVVKDEEPLQNAAEPSFTINDGADKVDAANPATEHTDAPAAETLISDNDYSRHFGIDDLYDPHRDLLGFQMPSTDMLQDWEVKNTKVTRDELIENKDRIVNTLRDYGIEIVEISATPGPTVTLYEIKPAPGVRIAKIKSLEDDIALSLSALGIRIIAPIPGKGTVGIEVPNAKPQIVSMKTMLSSDAFRNNSKMELPVALGKTISNEPFVTDLAKMPHLLMAGATGTGKSVGLNAVISSLLYKKHPSELKFVMVDPKKVELSLYSKIERHYLAKLPDSEEAIITDVKKVVRTLNSLCIEMDQRYDLLKQAQVRKITEYNNKFIHRHLNPDNGHRYLPYIVLVVDEFADLIMTAGKEVEGPICRLAQLARAVGIHLIIATQRPTTNIITGTIKANFPARIAFKVTSGIDSRTILDAGGAQRLIGRGDMLISLSGSDMVRLQCALIETEEIEKLADFIGEQRGYPEGFLLPEYLDENEEPNKEFDPKQKDEFFNDAARLVVASQFGSTSLLQRKLSLGYNRAGRIIDQLEAAGIVGPYNGSKPRDVLIHDDAELEERLREL